ncbi:hypothetical protein [Brevundimonas balnearis]|uniref:Glycosyltransferase n=1 Tax=Brevundimonas balnearis TaxID=1572858 RepID=A0ABV6QYH6_9CAUL
MDAPLKVIVGYDSREDIAWQVCRHSLERHASRPVQVIPLRQPVVRELGLYSRGLDATASTEFSLTRFLTPYLAATEGPSVFVDCDFLFTRDIHELIDSLAPGKAIHVVKHVYEPHHAVKMDGKAQTTYPRKNWSSFMVFNGGHPDVRKLTPAYVNSATPAQLHRFEWIEDDADIGELDREWNYLVGEYPTADRAPAAIHYTNGGPWFDEWRDCDYGDLWTAERALYEASRRGIAA